MLEWYWVVLIGAGAFAGGFYIGGIIGIWGLFKGKWEIE